MLCDLGRSEFGSNRPAPQEQRQLDRHCHSLSSRFGLFASACEPNDLNSEDTGTASLVVFACEVPGSAANLQFA